MLSKIRSVAAIICVLFLVARVLVPELRTKVEIPALRRFQRFRDCVLRSCGARTKNKTMRNQSRFTKSKVKFDNDDIEYNLVETIGINRAVQHSNALQRAKFGLFLTEWR